MFDNDDDDDDDDNDENDCNINGERNRGRRPKHKLITLKQDDLKDMIADISDATEVSRNTEKCRMIERTRNKYSRPRSSDGDSE